MKVTVVLNANRVKTLAGGSGELSKDVNKRSV